MSFSRYHGYYAEDGYKMMPKVTMDRVSTDLVVTFNKNTMRLDNLSYKYYGDANYGWLILLANPRYGSLEFRIPDKARLVIPYPLDDALRRYKKNNLNVN